MLKITGGLAANFPVLYSHKYQAVPYLDVKSLVTMINPGQIAFVHVILQSVAIILVHTLVIGRSYS